MTIRLHPNINNFSRGSFQGKFYKQESYSIEKKSTGEVYLTNANENTLYHFVILKGNILIGKANHNIISNNAPYVMAAGEIYVSLDPEGHALITKVTDQSGAYYVPNDDALAYEKKQSARAAMEVAGLPMDKFVPFSTSTPVLFSKNAKNDPQKGLGQEIRKHVSCLTK